MMADSQTAVEPSDAGSNADGGAGLPAEEGSVDAAPATVETAVAVTTAEAAAATASDTNYDELLAGMCEGMALTPALRIAKDKLKVTADSSLR
jgi:hypothetical protein